MEEILRYLKTNIDENCSIAKWKAKEYLNIQLAGSYDYYLVNAFSEDFLLIKPVDEMTIQKTSIHAKRINDKTGYEVAVLLENPSSYIIKKMIEERNAFITVDKQMYLPFLAIHLKQSRVKEIEAEDREKFTAATQQIFLYMLYSEQDSFEAEELMEKLKVSSMTVNRAMTMLKQIGIVSQEVAGKTGRKKIYTPIERKRYFQVGKEFLINPVQKSLYVKAAPIGVEMYKAGMTALGEQTMLGEPDNLIYAVCDKKVISAEALVTKTQAVMEGLPEIQIMKYDIGALTKNEYIDPISLIMSLPKKDDRTEIAIDELMEGIVWYEE